MDFGGVGLLGVIAAVLGLVGVSGAWVAARPETVTAAARAVWTWPWLVRLRDRYRRQIDFLIRRLRPEGAYGLSLTVGLGVLALAVFVFGGVLQDVLAREEVALLDGPVAWWVAAHRVGWLTAVMRVLTLLGGAWVSITVVLVAGLAWWARSRRWQPLLVLAVTAAGAGLLDLLVKLAVTRQRPPAALMSAAASGYAFPSGHTTQTAVYGALAFLLARAASSWRARVGIWAGALAVAVLVGLSRVYLGVHWLTDVLGGWTLATAWLAIVLTLTTTIDRRAALAAAPASPAAQTVPHRPPAAPGPPPPLQPVTVPEAARTSGVHGLMPAEVAKRIAAGQVNSARQPTSRSLWQIGAANVFTRFNALLGTLAAIVVLLGPLQDALFGLVILANTGIGIAQELRAKRVLDRLVLVAAPRAQVVRAGAIEEIVVERIVRDDVIEVHSGDQVPVDGLVLTADGLEVDESLLTGEAEPVARRPGEQVLAGSAVVAGVGRVQAVRVGADTYARRLAAQARRYQPTVSALRAGTNQILRYVTWVLPPAAGLLVASQLAQRDIDVAEALRRAVAGVVGMVPEGLVLLTSIAMAAAIVRLGRDNVLVQELAAVEALARVDVLCLDKTGTLTDGRLVLDRLVPADALPGGTAADHAPAAAVALAALAAADPHPTASLLAAAGRSTVYGQADGQADGPGDRAAPADPGWTRLGAVPFSSARKWSGVTFAGQGSVLLGAPERLLAGVPGAEALLEQARRHAGTGLRVLALAHSPTPLDATAPQLPADRRPLALVLLREQIRPDAAQTLRYFGEQGVTVKVISGDSRETVVAVARSVGVSDADSALDAGGLPDEPDRLAEAMAKHSVFARVSPHQKRAMVAALQATGHTVAMIGDGVNDVLALKDADLGVGLGTGTPAARAVAALVLLDGRFATLPGVVAEGRRVIGNIDRTAKLFVSKTAYVLLLAVAVGTAGVVFPFLPRQLTLIGTLTIGVPGFFLALAPNARRAQPGFVWRVLAFGLPSGAIAAASTLAAYALAQALVPADAGQARTAAVLTLALAGLSILRQLIGLAPGWQRLLPAAMLTALALAVLPPAARKFFALDLPRPSVWLVIVLLAALSHGLFLVTARLASPPAPRRAGARRPGSGGDDLVSPDCPVG